MNLDEISGLTNIVFQKEWRCANRNCKQEAHWVHITTKPTKHWIGMAMDESDALKNAIKDQLQRSKTR